MKYRVCKRCVMDTSDPLIIFDDFGNCNHCTTSLAAIEQGSLNSQLWDPADKTNSLGKIIVTLHKAQERSKYCGVLGLSGGIDSSFVTIKMKEYGLNPLVVHVDTGWNSQIAVRNIKSVLDYCGFDLYTYVVNWEEMRSLQLAYLKSGLSNLDVPQDHLIFATLFKVAREKGLKYFISGGNLATESINPPSWHEGSAIDSVSLKAINEKYGTLPLRSFNIIGFFDYYITLPFILKIRTVRPLNLMYYNREAAIKILESLTGWNNYGRKHGESFFTKVFQNDFLPRRYGYDKRRPHYSSQIVSGFMTREQAVEKLSEPLYEKSEFEDDIRFFCKKLKISRFEYEYYIKQPQRSFYEFPNWQRRYEVLKNINKFIEIVSGWRYRH